MPSDAVVEGISGAIGGCVATVATYPLMTASTRQATRFKRRSEAGAPPTEEKDKHKGTINELLETLNTTGFQSLYSGLSASLVGTTVSQGIYFYLYSMLRQAAVNRRAKTSRSSTSSPEEKAEVTIGESLLMAALAGMGNVLLTNPIWMVATRMQVHRQNSVATTSTPSQSKSASTSDKSKSTHPKDEEEGIVVSNLEIDPSTISSRARTPLSVAREVYSEYGIGGFWNGVGPSLVMVINPTIQYAFYEWLSATRAALKKKQGGAIKRPSALEVFLVSALAKAGATVLTYPLLTIKTRMMSARKSDADIQYRSVLDAVLQIARREGALGYYRGIRTKIVQSVLAAALLFMCKEKITEATRDLLMARSKKRLVAR